MEFYLTRTVCFDEETCIEAENLAELKAKLEDAELDWEVNFKDGAVWLEKLNAVDENGNEFELDPYTAPDNVGGMNGCIIFNEEQFNKYVLRDDD